LDSVGRGIRDIVSRHLEVPPEKVVDNARFIEDLGADSLDTMELVIAFEEAFGCEIPDEVATSVLTVGDARKYLEDKANT
jgi:acyl carrier protein